MTPAPRVSVVAATFNRADLAERLLRGLARQEGVESFEVVLADDGSTDGSLERLRALANELPYELRVLGTERNTGPAGARNRGWRAAQGELIVFTDDDVDPAPTWLAAMVRGFDDADIVVGRTKPPEEQRRLIGPFSHHLDMGHDGRFSTCNMGYRRSVLEAVDGFDERFLSPNGEDTDLGLRATKAGFRDTYVEDAVVWHDVRPSDFRAALRNVGRLDGIVALLKAHPETRQTLRFGWFLSSVHKAVFIGWAALLALAIPPLFPYSLVFVGVAAALYVWQFPKAHRPPARRVDWLAAVPQGFVYDSAAVLVLLRSSLRHRTLLL